MRWPCAFGLDGAIDRTVGMNTRQPSRAVETGVTKEFPSHEATGLGRRHLAAHRRHCRRHPGRNCNYSKHLENSPLTQPANLQAVVKTWRVYAGATVHRNKHRVAENIRPPLPILLHFSRGSGGILDPPAAGHDRSAQKNDDYRRQFAMDDLADGPQLVRPRRWKLSSSKLH